MPAAVVNRCGDFIITETEKLYIKKSVNKLPFYLFMLEMEKQNIESKTSKVKQSFIGNKKNLQ